VRRDPFALSASWGQSVHAALVRQAIEELEASLFLQPKDLATKLLLASAYLVGEPGTWEPNRAIELCRDIERADPNGAFGLDAQRMIPRVYASALNQAEANHLADALERARACVNAYLKLADQSADRDLAESMKAVVDAEFWSFNPPLNDVAGAIACLRRNVALAARTDPAKLPVDCDGLHQTAQAISWMVLAKPERADECRQLLRPWSGHASPHLRYLGLTNLAEIERRTGHFKQAGDEFAAVVKLCVSEKTKWFSVREERARLDAAGAYLKAGDAAAGFAILQPQIDVLQAGGMPSYEAAVALGELYEATGQFDRAIELYRQMMRRYPSGSAAADHLRTLLRAHPEKNATDVKVDYAIRQKGSSDVLCAGEQLIWTSNLYEVNWYDPRTERGGAVHRAAGDIIIVRLAWTSNHQLWAGTNGHGLWRLDTQAAAPSLADKDPWVKVAGLPDDNVTCMVAGDEGDLFVAVGVTTPGVGAAVKGGVVRIDAEGKVHPLVQPGGPRIAPDHMVWLPGHLWSKSQEGVFHLDLKAGTWKRLYIGRSIYIGSGIERILLVDIDRRDRIRRALWAPPTTTGGEGDLHEIINAPELLIGLSLESPNAFWFSGRAQGASGGRELQCVDKTTGRMTTINEAVGPPFSTVNDAIWFQDRLWLATYKGLVTVDAVHFPKAAAPAATAPATRRATENH
jgi:tetratricopeptide (TPR) repeat protein